MLTSVEQVQQIPLSQDDLRRMAEEPITNEELRRAARSRVGNDPERIERMVSAYRAGERLGAQLDHYAAAGIKGGLPGAEAALKRSVAR